MATVIPADPTEAAPADQYSPDGGPVRRVRHPASLIRALSGLFALCLLLLLSHYAQATAGGLDADVAQGASKLPWPPVQLAGALCTAGLLLVPLAFAAERLFRGERRRVADGVLATVTAYGLSLGLDLLLDRFAALSVPITGGQGHTDPVYGHLAPALAFMTAVGMAGLPRWRTALTVALSAAGLSGLVSGYATPLSVLLALLLGWTTAHGTCYAIGEPTDQPTVRQILLALRQSGVRPHRLQSLGGARYLVVQQDDLPELEVRLLDRRAQASGLLPRIWQLLRLRTAPRPLGLRSLRAYVEHQALLGFAAAAAGTRSPAPTAVTELGPNAALVAYPRVTALPLRQLDDAELTDEVLTDAWRQLQLLQNRRIAHRALGPDTVLVDSDGRVHLADLSDGEIAAGELLLRLDITGLLTTLALRVGPERAVASAMAVLGRTVVGAAIPLLQPIALPRSTRLALKQHKGLTAELRAEALRHLPQAPTEPVRLERLRPRTVVTVVAGFVAGYLLYEQLFGGDVSPFTAVAQANPLWLAVAAVAAGASYLAATLSFIGFVPERLSFHRALAAQLACSFVKLVAPGGVGGPALNTRFLQRCGIPTGQALASVGASNLLGLGLHLLQIAAFGALVGSSPSEQVPTVWLVIGLAAAGVVLLGTAGVPALRRRAQRLLRPLRSEVLPRLLELAQQPGKLIAGMAGQLSISLTFVVCLYCCTRALGEHPSFAAIGVACLAGNTIGSAMPTPGSAGGIETATAGLMATLAAMGYDKAVAAVFLFRLLVFILPVLPGWAAFTWLQRRGAL